MQSYGAPEWLETENTSDVAVAGVAELPEDFEDYGDEDYGDEVPDAAELSELEAAVPIGAAPAELTGIAIDPTGPAKELLAGDLCTFSSDCISTCCAMNIEIDTTEVLGYSMYDTTMSYTEAEIESI